MKAKIIVKAYSLALAILVLCFAIESALTANRLPRGLLIGIIQCLMSMVAAFAAIFSFSRKKYRGFALVSIATGFICFAFADFYWSYLFYYIHQDRNHWVAVVLTQFPYAIGYLSMLTGLLQATPSLKSKQNSMLLAGVGLVSIPFFLKYIVYPTVQKFNSEGLSFFLIGHSLNSLSCSLLLYFSIVSLLKGRDLFWGLIATGCSALALENWSFRAEMLIWKSPEYGFYDYVWAFGIITATTPVILLLKDKIEYSETQIYDYKSLVSQSRLWLIGSMLSGLTLLTLVASPQYYVLRFITIGTLFAIISSIFLSHFIAEKIEDLALMLSLEITDELGIHSISEKSRSLPMELRIIYQKLFSKRLQERKAVEMSQVALANLAVQVAHDIKSPLAALSVVENELVALPEDTRTLIRSAIGRIRDISNQLVEKYRVQTASLSHNAVVSSTMEVCSTQILTSLIDEIISEKRMQIRSVMGIEIELEVNEKHYGLFANVQSTEFKRVLSNLLNNSIEAIDRRGRIRIELKELNNEIELTVRDDGEGISEENLGSLMQRGISYNKMGGSGLGLFHARTSIEKWGGQLRIESKIGLGTAVIAVLPKASAPSWFVKGIDLRANANVIVLDDDESIHHIWKNRFEQLKILKKKQIQLHHFSTPDEFLSSYSTQIFSNSEQAIYLVDYEFQGLKTTGLDVIEKLGIQNKSILVTSRYEHAFVLNKCMQQKVNIIPKGMAGFVPLA